MNTYTKTYEVKWADMDLNRHMRHSAYNDYAAQTRVAVFTDHGLSMEEIAKAGLGPVLFREEAKYFKEVNLFDKVTITCKIKAMRKDGSRWTIVHEIFKNEDVKAAEITVDGAWLELKARKLGIPTGQMQAIFDDFPKTDDFEWLPEKSSK